MIIKSKIKKMEIKARVFRAKTGKWEDVGIISSTDLFWKVKHFIKNLIKKYGNSFNHSR